MSAKNKQAYTVTLTAYLPVVISASSSKNSNRTDPNQNLLNIDPDLDRNDLYPPIHVIFKKSAGDDKSMEKYPAVVLVSNKCVVSLLTI